MLNRRDFLINSATISAAALLAPSEILKSSALLNKIGVQFFSLPKSLDADFKGTVEMLAKIGFREVELFGPFPFSDEGARKSWDAVTGRLGFKGSGYFGHTAAEVKNIMRSNGMSIPAVHTDFITLQKNMDKLGEAAQTLGYTYAILPSIPAENRKTLDDYKKTADTFNKIGESAKKNGIKFGYHNHGYGWKEENGKRPIDIIFDNTNHDTVFFEMDLFWTTAAGVNPIELFQKHKNRYRAMHVKDGTKQVRYSGDGNDPKQWFELFPFMTSAGSGVFDLKNILPAAKANGVKHFFVEQDLVKDPEIALKASFDYLKSLQKV